MKLAINPTTINSAQIKTLLDSEINRELASWHMQYPDKPEMEVKVRYIVSMLDYSRGVYPMQVRFKGLLKAKRLCSFLWQVHTVKGKAKKFPGSIDHAVPRQIIKQRLLDIVTTQDFILANEALVILINVCAVDVANVEHRFTLTQEMVQNIRTPPMNPNRHEPDPDTVAWKPLLLRSGLSDEALQAMKTGEEQTALKVNQAVEAREQYARFATTIEGLVLAALQQCSEYQLHRLRLVLKEFDTRYLSLLVSLRQYG